MFAEDLHLCLYYLYVHQQALMPNSDCFVVIFCFLYSHLKDVLEALKSLSSFFDENNIRSRRNLRSDIERRSLVINEEFVECFRQVKEVIMIIQ